MGLLFRNQRLTPRSHAAALCTARARPLTRRKARRRAPLAHRSSRAHNRAVRHRTLAAPEPARLPAEALKLHTFSLFAKHFKLYRQLIERK